MEKASLRNINQIINYDVTTFHHSHTEGYDIQFLPLGTLALNGSKQSASWYTYFITTAAHQRQKIKF
jgi:hypothetical protein